MKQKHNFMIYGFFLISKKTFQEPDKAPEVTVNLIIISSFK